MSSFNPLIKIKSAGNNRRTLSDKVISLIAEELTNVNTKSTSYAELQLLLEEQTQEKVAYGVLYSHCNKKKTKLKVARKSHHKRDPNAAAFFQNSKGTV